MIISEVLCAEYKAEGEAEQENLKIIAPSKVTQRERAIETEDCHVKEATVHAEMLWFLIF